MKDLNLESNGDSWPSCFGESNLSNGQFYYGYHPRTVTDSHLGYDKDFVKQTMLEHEAVFQNQVYELHRLYSVQRDLMEVRRKENCKRRIPYETSSSSSPIPSQMQYEDIRRWNSQNLPLTNSNYGRPPILVPETFQSSPNSAKGKSLQAGPSSLPNCYSPKNSESESRPTKLRRKMLDLQLPAEEYLDTDEVEQFNDVKNLDYTSTSSNKNRKSVCLADLNEPLLVDEATSVTSVDFLCQGGGSQCDSMYRDFSTRTVNTFKDVPQHPKKSNMNGTSNNVHFENKSNGADWLRNGLKSENKGSTRSINQVICREKMLVPSPPVHILLDQARHPPTFQSVDHVKGDSWKAKSDRVGYSHLSNQPGYSYSSDLGKPSNQCAPWGKPGNFLGQKPISIQTSPYVSSVQSNDQFSSNKWNLNNTPSAFGNETPMRNGFYEGSSSTFKGFDSVNRNYIDKKGPCSSINYCKAENCIDLNPMKGVNLNVPLSNGLNDDHIIQQGVTIVEQDQKSKDSLPLFPWIRGNTACNNGVENSRKDLNSHESALSRLGSSVGSNSVEVDVKAKISDSNRKILGVPIFENSLTPKKEVSKPMINKGSESSGRKLDFDMNVPCEEEIVILEEKPQTESSSMRHNFDLNLCINDEENPCETIRVDTGIDLEAPVILENEEVDVITPKEDSLINEPQKDPILPVHKHDDGESEIARSAASVIVAMSSLVNLNQSEEATCLRVETDLDDPLHWFVEIACSNNQNNIEIGNDLLPECFDDFEMMTLRLKECNEEEYFPKPSFPEVPDNEERGTCVLTTTRARKGHARRGRQRRDFQRDILPGLTTLSRHEVSEDLQTFGGLMRATGHTWQSAPNRKNTTRNGCARGRRRSVGTRAGVVGPGLEPVAALCALPVKQKTLESNNAEVGVDDRSLTSWGKTTRRPRRQRCPNGHPAPPASVPLT